MEAQENKKKTLNEIIFDILLKEGEIEQVGEDKYRLYGEADFYSYKAIINDIEGTDEIHGVPKEEYPLFIRLMQHTRQVWKDLEKMLVTPKDLEKAQKCSYDEWCDSFYKEIYDKQYGLLYRIRQMRTISQDAIDRMFDDCWERHENKKNDKGDTNVSAVLSFTYYVFSSLYTILYFRGDKDGKAKKTASLLELKLRKIRSHVNQYNYVAILKDSMAERRAWREAEADAAFDAATKSANTDLFLTLQACAKQVRTWQEQISYLESINDTLMAEKSFIEAENMRLEKEKKEQVAELEKELAKRDSEVYKKKVGEQYIVEVVKKELEEAEEMDLSARLAKYDEMKILLEMEGIPKEVKILIRALRKKGPNERSAKEGGNTYIYTSGSTHNDNSKHLTVGKTDDNTNKLLGK